MSLKSEFDAGHAGPSALGLIVLQTDETVEIELRSIFSAADIACYHSRIPSHALVTPQTLAQMETALPASAALLPAGVNFGAIGYACTSGATVIGQQKVANTISRAHPGARVTDPITAVIAALRSLNAKKIGLLTPYIPDVTIEMQNLLIAQGFEIAAIASFEQQQDRLIARLTETATLAGIEQLTKTARCDAIFASCTNLRTFGIIDAAERSFGVPVISSNLALGWHMLDLAGRQSRGVGPGRLFQA